MGHCISGGRSQSPLPPALSLAAAVGVEVGGPAKPALGRQAEGVASVVNINDVLDGHVALEVECVDRLYLNAYVPNLQVAARW